MSHGKTERERERELGAELKQKMFSVGKSCMCKNQTRHEQTQVNATNKITSLHSCNRDIFCEVHTILCMQYNIYMKQLWSLSCTLIQFFTLSSFSPETHSHAHMCTQRTQMYYRLSTLGGAVPESIITRAIPSQFPVRFKCVTSVII